MPDVKFKTRDEIPEEFRSEAKEVDGSFVINLVPKARLDEFRDKNISVMQERDALKARIDTYVALAGDDPEKFKAEITALRAVDQQVKDGKLTSSKAIDEEVSRRMAEGKQGYETQIRTLATERDAAVQAKQSVDQRYRQSILDREVTNAVLAETGINPAALPDILTRARAVFQVTDADKIVAKTGDTIIYGSDGVNPMQPKEWLRKLVQDAPHFAKPSSGGGAGGGSKAEFGGLSEAEFLKLSPTQRMNIARTKAKA